MTSDQHTINVFNYDAAVRNLTENPGISFDDAASICGLSPNTIRKVWNGTISRPTVVVVQRLSVPRRFPQCGVLCCDWPCVRCEMQRRRENAQDEADLDVRFEYSKA